MLGQGYHGGIPPTLEDIEDNVEKVDIFVSNWLGHHTRVSVPMQRFLVANMLRHWHETVDLIQKEPKGIYSDDNYKKHNYVHKIFDILHNINVSEETFLGWVKSVRHGFIKRNALSMSQEVLQEIGYTDIMVDTRSMLEKMEMMSTQ